MSGRVPPSSRAKSRRPISHDAEIKRAARLFERFTGHEAEEVGRVKVPAIPKVGVIVGDLDGVLYTTVRDGITERYIHEFAKRDKPMLVVSPDGKSIHVIGGRYTFTERGIVDKSDKTS
jgi:hypothetical protein